MHFFNPVHRMPLIEVIAGRQSSPEAVATVQKAIELDPTNPEHHYALGWLQLNQSVTGSAERSFRQALELEPRMAPARMGLAEVARRRGDYTRALEELGEIGVTPPPLLRISTTSVTRR